jgi:hypothetical protein
MLAYNRHTHQTGSTVSPAGTVRALISIKKTPTPSIDYFFTNIKTSINILADQL